MGTIQLNAKPFGFTSLLYALSGGALWFCPAFALAFMWINAVLMFLGIHRVDYLLYTVGLPVALTAVALLVNLSIEITHLPRRGREDS